jgi:hypothetical protein
LDNDQEELEEELSSWPGRCYPFQSGDVGSSNPRRGILLFPGFYTVLTAIVATSILAPICRKDWYDESMSLLAVPYYSCINTSACDVMLSDDIVRAWLSIVSSYARMSILWVWVIELSFLIFQHTPQMRTWCSNRTCARAFLLC